MSGDGYFQRNKERAAERSRAVSLAGREIGVLPPIRNARRRAEGRASLLAFLRAYFPEKFVKPFGSCHLQLIDSIQTIFTKGGKQAVAMPRGSGKSTICKAAVIWAALTGRRSFVVVVCANTREARNMLKSIYTDLSTNPLLIEDYPEGCYSLGLLKGSQSLARGQLYRGQPVGSRFTADEIVLPTIPGSPVAGAVIAAYGANAAVRGLAREAPGGKTKRPDALFLDDLQTDKLAVNSKRVEELERKVSGTFEGLAGAGESLAIVQTCTCIADGDYASMILNRETHARWNGLRVAALPKEPSNVALWNEYKNIWVESPEEATRFYRANLAAMQEGAELSWREMYDGSGAQFDTLEYLMCKKLESPEAFAAEYQNQPVEAAFGAIQASASVVRSRLSGFERGVCPSDATRITVGVDVHDDLLYYVVGAWRFPFVGRVIDYGTFPRQRRSYFSKSDGGLETLAEAFPGVSAQERVLNGLSEVFADLLNREFPTEKEGDYRKVDKILVDEGWRPEVVADAARRFDERLIMTTKGVSIKATSTPMQYWKKQAGRAKGWHMVDERLDDSAFRRTRPVLLVDVNYYKTLVHSGFLQAANQSDSLSLFGDDSKAHRMFGDHITAEKGALVVCASNRVVEWSTKPHRPDNHLFDCCVLCLAGAVSVGIFPADYPGRRQ